MSGTLEAFTEILTRSKSTSRKYASSSSADSTIASAVTLPPWRAYRSGCSDPPFTPMRMGTPRSRHSAATVLMCSGRRMFPGFRRRQATFASRAASAMRYW